MMHLNSRPSQGVYPSAFSPAARKHERVHAILVDDGQVYDAV
jgi:hypothetical protein